MAVVWRALGSLSWLITLSLANYSISCSSLELTSSLLSLRLNLISIQLSGALPYLNSFLKMRVSCSTHILSSSFSRWRLTISVTDIAFEMVLPLPRITTCYWALKAAATLVTMSLIFDLLWQQTTCYRFASFYAACTILFNYYTKSAFYMWVRKFGVVLPYY